MTTFTISADELTQHCRSRASHHKTRMEEKQAELPKLIESFDVLRKRKSEDIGIGAGKTVSLSKDLRWPDGSTASYKGDETTIEGIEKEIRNHAVKASRFTFFADHSGKDDFDLTVPELEAFEFIPGTSY